MTQEFQNVKPNGEWSNHNSLAQTMGAARGQIPFGLRPYTLKKNGKILVKGARKFVLARLEANLRHGKVGDDYSIWAGKRIRFRCREVKPAYQVIDTNGNDKADRAWGAAVTVFRNISFLGAYVCKHISGSYNMSQHSYGNALDIGADSMTDLNDIAQWFVSHAVEFDLQHVIVGDRIWTRGSGWHYYGGDYHYHVHLDFNPNFSGSCGVRN